MKKNKFLEKVSAKYPNLKKSKHSGDSHLLYEAGKRDPEDPFGTKSFNEFVEENEGKDAEGMNNFEVSHQGLSRDSGNYPVEKELDQPYGLDVEDRQIRNLQKPLGYPLQTDWWQQALSVFPNSPGAESSIKNLAMAATLIKHAWEDLKNDPVMRENHVHTRLQQIETELDQILRWLRAE